MSKIRKSLLVLMVGTLLIGSSLNLIWMDRDASVEKSTSIVITTHGDPNPGGH